MTTEATSCQAAHISAYFLKELWKRGLPPNLTLTNVASLSAKHANDHCAVENEFIKPLGIAEDFTNWVKEDTADIPSLMLVSLRRHMNDNAIYAGGNTIETLVETLLSDILSLLGLIYVVDLVRSVSVTNEPDGAYWYNNTDYWTIMLDGRPIGLFMAKPPRAVRNSSAGQPSVLEDPAVVGQACDHMLDLQSFHGLAHVFCITSTMEQFRVHWFPVSDAYAAATDLPAHTGHQITRTPAVAQRREVNSSRVFQCGDLVLMRMLATVVVKAYCAPFQPVHLVHPDRMYIELRPDGWQWRQLTPDQCSNLQSSLTLTMSPHTQDCTTFTVVRALFRGEAHKVWLAVADTTPVAPPALVVMKQCEGKAAAEAERDLWYRVNHCSAVFCTTVNGLHSVVMPLALHAKLDVESGKPYFDFELQRWCTADHAVPGEFPDSLRQLADELRALAPNHADVKAAAVRAIERAAAVCVVHDDLEWRHVALLPVIVDGHLRRLEPVLIDFRRVRTAGSVEEAREAMLGRLEVLVSYYEEDDEEEESEQEEG